jgi:hydrogenase maturation protein HypF
MKGKGRMSEDRVRQKIRIQGIVQGIGFRPYVCREAQRRRLSGWVQNSRDGVELEVEGERQSLQEFLKELKSCPLPQAWLRSVVSEEVPPRGGHAFSILPSSKEGRGNTLIPPDLALCPQCRRDILTPGNRRFQYPFTNCTACGPRFTIIRSLPYDRQQTAMASFPLCPLCRKEYQEAADRRFHAQPNACPSCGPRPWLADARGREIDENWLPGAAARLLAGEILAVKGLGGFHLACDATQAAALARLRKRKQRPAKPFAVMCRNTEQASFYCYISGREAKLLESPAAPIVILGRRPEVELPPALAPDTDSLGVMLPYTPLHHLLLEAGPPMLVMTSGNISGLPLATDNRQALEQLGEVADTFLLHDRPILRPCEDSLARVASGRVRLLRRSRGYVPLPLTVPVPGPETVTFAAGGDMKNSFCYLIGNLAYPGPHNGDLETEETRRAYEDGAAQMAALLGASPAQCAFDPHPGYHSSAFARKMPAPSHQPVWHHHAHMASCMGENGLTGEVIGIICDGTGYGPDGTLWGGEIFTGGYRDFRRQFHLEAVALPGGEEAVRHPWRTAVAWLWHCLGHSGLDAARELFPRAAEEAGILTAMLERGFNSPLSSGCGRLYDAAAAILGICTENTYDGQAPTELSALAGGRKAATYPFRIQGSAIACDGLIRGLLAARREKINLRESAARFEATVAAMFATGAARARARTGLNRVVLSGGCFQSPTLTEMLQQQLEEAGFAVYRHALVPAGDGGLALGQALVTAWKGCGD